MVTIKQIAEIAGVSRGTVDRVLNNRNGVNKETSKRVNEIAKQLGYAPNIPGQMLAARKKKIKLGFIICDISLGVFFADVYDAAQAKAKELKQYGVTVTFYLIKELTDTHVESVLNQAENDCLDGVALMPLRMPSVSSFIKKAANTDLPLVFFNIDSNVSPRLSYVGCDYKTSGKVAAGLISLVVNGKGKIAVANIFNNHSPSFSERLAGFLEEIDSNYPDIQVLNRDADYLFQRDDFSNIINLVRATPNLEALYVINPGDYQICQEIKKYDQDNHIKIITNDFIKEQKYMIDDGIISATICQQPEKQGALPLQLLYNYLGLGMVPEDKYLTELSIYIKQNINTNVTSDHP